MRLSRSEETLVRLLRLLDSEQQPDFTTRFIGEIRAQVLANGISADILDRQQLRVTGNRRVEETLGLPKRRPVTQRLDPKPGRAKPSRKSDDDDLDPGTDDALG